MRISRQDSNVVLITNCFVQLSAFISVCDFIFIFIWVFVPYNRILKMGKIRRSQTKLGKSPPNLSVRPRNFFWDQNGATEIEKGILKLDPILGELTCRFCYFQCYQKRRMTAHIIEEHSDENETKLDHPESNPSTPKSNLGQYEGNFSWNQLFAFILFAKVNFREINFWIPFI